MAKTYGYKPPVKETPPTQETNTSKSKSRIYQKFKPTIILDELSIPGNPSSSAQNQESLSSLQYPLIKINDYIISVGEIDSLIIDCTEFLPRITLKCTFLYQTFISKDMPKDGDIISIAIRNKTNLLKSLRNDYVITGVVSNNNPTTIIGPITMTFFGILFIPYLSTAKYNISHEGTSFEAMKELAKKIGLGFATNEDNTDDKQIWISGNSTLMDYINKTIQRSWRDESSFYDIWIDIYYNLNFVNLNKQLMSSESEVDLAAFVNNIDKDFTWGEDNKTSDTAKVFSNYRGYRTSSFYITNWRPNNRSTNITFQIGTKMSCQMFEHNENLYLDPESQKYWNIPLEPTYDPEKINKYILLRGRAQQNPSTRGKDLALANYPYVNMYEKQSWLGIQYTISNSEEDNLQWDGNQHRNYLRARVQNLINKKELEKLNLEINVNGLNLNVIRGDKLPVVLIKTDVVTNKMINEEVGTWDMLDQFYSGWFLVKGFKITYNQENADSVMSNFSQSFILTRREWPPPIAVDAIVIPPNENNS